MKRTIEETEDDSSQGSSKRVLATEAFDPFENHFCSNVGSKQFFDQLKAGKFEERKAIKPASFKNFVSHAIWRKSTEVVFTDEERLQYAQFGIKPSLFKNFETLNPGKTDRIANELYQVIGSYMDLTLISPKDFTHLICLHALNHAMRTRQLIVRNKQMLEASKDSLDDSLIEQCRDQGLARPKVLILCPFKKHAYEIVQTMMQLVFGDTEKVFISNLGKFEDEFGDDGNRVHDKRDVSDEYKELMSGNVDDCFRLGIGIAKKALKLYTTFEESDILLCSPLGLRMIIGDETEKKREYDFLASIEVMVIDKAHLLLMQNWEHLINIFQTVNTNPTKISTDISRVRQWSLNDYGKFYRQTLIFSAFNSVEIQALSSRFCHNFAGQVSLIKGRKSIVEEIEIPIVQGFYKFEFGSPDKQSDNRFNFFVKEILPKCGEHTLIFVSSYYDFIRMRNYLKRENSSFVQVHEYASKGKIAKARNVFFLGQKKLMLLTERYYFYFRSKIKGVESVVFYQLPINPEFYVELLNNARPEKRLNSKVLFCEYDFIRLQNIFGTESARDLVRSTSKCHALIGE